MTTPEAGEDHPSTPEHLHKDEYMSYIMWNNNHTSESRSTYTSESRST